MSYDEESDTQAKIQHEALVRLYVMPLDTNCAHILKYIAHHEAQNCFEVIYANQMKSRPPWLLGVPTVLFRTELKDGGFSKPRVLAGEEALRFIRETTEGPSYSSGYHGGNELEVYSSRKHSSVSNCDLTEPMPNDDENESDMLCRLLPIPSTYTNSILSALTDEDFKRAMKEREADTEHLFD